MVDGTYDLLIETSAGAIAVVLTIKGEPDGTLSGTLSALGSDQPVHGYITQDDGYGVVYTKFSGELSIMFKKVSYLCEGTIDEDGTVEGDAVIEDHAVKITGSRHEDDEQEE